MQFIVDSPLFHEDQPEPQPEPQEHDLRGELRESLRELAAELSVVLANIVPKSGASRQRAQDAIEQWAERMEERLG